MAKDHHTGSGQQEEGMLTYRPPVIAARIGERARCAEDFNHRYETKQQEDYPNDLVSFEYTLQ